MKNNGIKVAPLGFFGNLFAAFGIKEVDKKGALKMNKQSKTIGAKKANTASKGDIMDTSLAPENKCHHCGGALKFTPDGDVCMMCGRDKAHRCEHCLYGDADVAA